MIPAPLSTTASMRPGWHPLGRTLAGAGVLLAALSGGASAQPTSLADTVSMSVEEGLRYVLRGEELPHGLGTQLILRVGATHNPGAAPLLREILAMWAARHPETDVVYEDQTAAALHVLWRQGVGQEYFFDLVRGWSEDYTLAVQAARMLARTPTPEVMSVLGRAHIAARSSGRRGHIGQALGTARYIAHLIELYEALPTVEARAEMTVGVVGRWWGPFPMWSSSDRISASGWKEVGFSNPGVWVASGWFLSLSHEAPDAVARAIEASYEEARAEEARGRLFPGEPEAYRRWFRNSVPSSVRAHLPE